MDGHPWVFKSEIDRIEGNPERGVTVELRGVKGQFLGCGIYNDLSQITFRRYTRGHEAFDTKFLEQQISTALAYRDTLNREGIPAAQRLVWSESDGLPGLIVDRYGDQLVLQTLTFAMSNHEETVVEILKKKLNPKIILARNDAPVRQLEGLKLEKKMWLGDYQSPTILKMLGLEWHLDLWNSQKTGFYLDQMENYKKVAAYAKGRRILDCFTNQGAFALSCMLAGAISCRAIEQSADALDKATALSKNHHLKIDWIEGNVFDLLPHYEKERQNYDLIILDPPSFTKTKSQVDSALRGYKELHLRAIRMLTKGGLLASFCCSHHVGEIQWRDLLTEVAAETNVSLRLVERMTQSRDHPILTEVPETEYLRGYLLEKMA